MITVPYLHDIRVFDAIGRHVVGHVVALEEDGLQMVADQAFDSGPEHMLMIDDLTAMEPGRKVLFSATCDRCDLDGEIIDLYHVHLCFTHLSPQAEEMARLMAHGPYEVAGWMV